MKLDLNALQQHVPSKYEIVVAAAKRARQLVDGAPALIASASSKPVSIALEEMMQGVLEFEFPDEQPAA